MIFHIRLCHLFSFLWLSYTILNSLNPIALRMAKALWSFGRSECNMVKADY